MAELSLEPPTVQVDPELMAKYEEEMNIAAGTALPAEEEDNDL